MQVARRSVRRQHQLVPALFDLVLHHDRSAEGTGAADLDSGALARIRVEVQVDFDVGHPGHSMKNRPTK